MRVVLFALSLALAIPAEAAPSAEQLKQAWSMANGNCRGGDPESMKSQLECDRRSRLTGRLEQLGWCYGRKDQATYQYRWHHCTAQSMQGDDLRESKF